MKLLADIDRYFQTYWKQHKDRIVIYDVCTCICMLCNVSGTFEEGLDFQGFSLTSTPSI